MVHKDRRWYVTPVDSPEQLAHYLTQRASALGTGFELAGYLFLNDSMSEHVDPAYAVIKGPSGYDAVYREIDNIDFGSRDYETALGCVLMAIRGALDHDGTALALTVETSARHRSSPLCRVTIL